MLAVITKKKKPKVTEVQISAITTDFIKRELNFNRDNAASTVTRLQAIVTVDAGSEYNDRVRCKLLGCKKIPQDAQLANKRIYELVTEVASQL